MSGARAEVGRLLRYAAVGLASNGALYLAFLALLAAGASPPFGAGLCYLAGVGVSYVLNRSWTFASTGSHRSDLARFLLAYGIGLASTLATITLLVRWLPAEIAQIVNIGLTALVIYGSLRVVGFGHRQEI